MLALLSIPIYVSGIGSMAALSDNARFSKDAIATHYVWGVAALAVLVIAGIAAGVELWRSWPPPPAAREPLPFGLGLGAVPLGPAPVPGAVCFAINHPRLQVA